ncbi:hypothetical protein BYT27DRAFT_7080853 [Phlegmacium glaucopus]|nr:hypothetical protein BYT27DRAFT_7080853 [Phlegmacium glaucopus]
MKCRSTVKSRGLGRAKPGPSRLWGLWLGSWPSQAKAVAFGPSRAGTSLVKAAVAGTQPFKISLKQRPRSPSLILLKCLAVVLGEPLRSTRQWRRLWVGVNMNYRSLRSAVSKNCIVWVNNKTL